MKESRLIDRLVAKDHAAWEEFVATYGGTVYSVAIATLERAGGFRSHEIEDLTQDVFLHFLKDNCKAIANFRRKASLKTYVALVTRSRTLDLLRKKRPVPLHQEAASAIPVADETGRVDAKEDVDKLLTELPPRDKLILALFYREGKTYREIAEVLRIPDSSVGQTLARARARLKEKFEEK